MKKYVLIGKSSINGEFSIATFDFLEGTPKKSCTPPSLGKRRRKEWIGLLMIYAWELVLLAFSLLSFE
jgi:hypothetical protein